MPSFKLISLATASLFLFQGAYASNGTDTTSQSNATAISCLAQVNEARKLVGFKEYTEDTGDKNRLTDTTTNTDIAKSICEALKGSGDTVVPTTGTQGTLAYHKQTGENGDCAAAVSYFKSGISALGSERPGAYKDGQAPFNTGKAVSFAAIFNPTESGVLHCAFFKCPSDTTGATTQSDNAAKADEAKGLACLVIPPALEVGKEPFTKDQFKALTKKLTSDATAGVPAAIALLAVAAGISLF